MVSEPMAQNIKGPISYFDGFNMKWVFAEADIIKGTFHERVLKLYESTLFGTQAYSIISLTREKVDEQAKSITPMPPEDTKWNRFKEEIAKSIPQSAESDLDKIKRIKKNPGEDWMQFFTRYQMEVENLKNISDSIKTKELYLKLPKNLKIMVEDLDPLIPLEEMIQRLRRIYYWRSIDKVKESERHLDFMEIDHLETNVNVTIRDNGMVDFTSIKTMRDFFETLEHLVKKGTSFRDRTKKILEKTNGYGYQNNRKRFDPNMRYKPRIQAYNMIQKTLPGERTSGLKMSPKEHVSDIPINFNNDTYNEEQYSDIGEWKEAEEILTIQNENPILMHCPMKFNNKSIKSLIDTGAMTSIIPYSLCKKYGFPINEYKKKTLQGFEGSKIITEGTTLITVEVGDKMLTHEFEVTKKTNKLITGNDLLKKLKAIPNPSEHTLQFLNSDIIIPCYLYQETKGNIINEKGDKRGEKILQFEKDAKIPPKWDQDHIQVTCNRNFWLKPKETKLIYLPVKCNKKVIISPYIHPNLRIETGIQEENQYFKIRVYNLSEHMFHMTEKTKLGVIERKQEDKWSYVRDGSAQQISHSKN